MLRRLILTSWRYFLQSSSSHVCYGVWCPRFLCGEWQSVFILRSLWSALPTHNTMPRVSSYWRWCCVDIIWDRLKGTGQLNGESRNPSSNNGAVDWTVRMGVTKVQSGAWRWVQTEGRWENGRDSSSLCPQKEKPTTTTRAVKSSEWSHGALCLLTPIVSDAFTIMGVKLLKRVENQTKNTAIADMVFFRSPPH